MLRDPRRNVELNVGKACNARCAFCVDGEASPEARAFVSLDLARAELGRWHAQGYRSLGFLGGEPTAWAGLLPAVAFARELGFTRITVCTNGLRLRDGGWTRRLVGAGVTRVTVSMHGPDASVEDRLTGVPGAFARKCAALRNLAALQREGALPDGLSVNLVLNGWNHAHLPRALRLFFEELGLADVRANCIRPEGRARGDRSLAPPFRALLPSLVKGIVLNERRFRKVFTFGDFPMCVLPRPLRLDADLLARTMGEYRDLATACSIRAEGRGPRDTVVDIEGDRARFDWRERRVHDLKVRPPKCEACALVAACEGVWREWHELWGDEELVPLGAGDVALGNGREGPAYPAEDRSLRP